MTRKRCYLSCEGDRSTENEKRCYLSCEGDRSTENEKRCYLSCEGDRPQGNDKEEIRHVGLNTLPVHHVTFARTEQVIILDTDC